MGTSRARRGMALFITLLITVVFVILMSTLVVTCTQNLLLMGTYRDRVGALKMAEAGASHAIYTLGRNIFDRGDLSSTSFFTAAGTYSLTFDTNRPFYSVNQLGTFTGQRVNDCLGNPVPYDTAVLVVTGTMNATVRRLHVVVRRGVTSPYALTSLGRVSLAGNCSVSGIQDLQSRAPLPGVIHSNHASTSATDYSINWDGTGTFGLNSTGYLACVGGANPTPIGPSLVSAVQREQVRTGAPPVQVPRIDIPQAVSQHSACPSPRVDSTSGGVKVASGQVSIGQNTYVSGSYHLDGDINLQGGALYVDGDLTVNGAVRGVGAVYVSGSTTVRGDAIVTTNQGDAAALYSHGDVNLAGLDAATYLDSLAGSHPSTVGTALTNLRSELANLKAQVDTLSANPSAITAGTLAALWQSEEKLGGRGGPGLNWQGSCTRLLRPGPDGTYAQANSASYIMALRLALEGLPGYSTDARAQKLVTALDGMNYFFRDSFLGSKRWDDDGLPTAQRSLDHLFRMDPRGDPTLTFVTSSDTTAGGQYVRACSAFLAQNGTDMTWTGRSSFQGAVYSDGNLNASNNFDVIGVVVLRGDVNLTGGSSLIYDQEYCKLVAGQEAPMLIVSWREL